jgi:hypothetical protein
MATVQATFVYVLHDNLCKDTDFIGLLQYWTK